jgi:4-amino-4-deoxy-L-arabinose transferase-like glycosyltransferase
LNEPDARADTRAARRDLILLAIGCLIFFGVRLGARDLWNPNEPIYGEAVREMTARGTWLVPYVNGLVFGEKPILYYWLALLASRAFGGVTELSLRVPSLLAGTSIVLGAYVLVQPYAGRRRALLTALCAVTTYGIWWNARSAQMDILAAAATLWVVVPVTRVLDHGLSPWKGWIAAGAVAGLGFLGKGPVAWVCPALALVAYAGITGRLRTLFRLEVLSGAAVCLAVASPWYLALYAGGRTDVLFEVLIRQNFQRFTNPWDHVAPFWYYVPYFFVDMAPWSFLAILAWRLPRGDERERRLALLAAVWIVAVIAFFSLSKSKRDPYILPVAPAAAILAAEVLLAFIEGRLTAWRRRAVLVVAAGFGAMFLAGSGVIAWWLARRYPQTALQAYVLAAAVFLGGTILLATLMRSRWRRGIAVPAALAGAVGLLYLTAAASALPAADIFKSARPLSEEVAALAGPDDTIASYNFWNWRSEFRYYLGRPIVNLQGVDPLREAWGGPRRVVLFVEETQLAGARAVIGDEAPERKRKVGSSTFYVFVNR